MTSLCLFIVRTENDVHRVNRSNVKVGHDREVDGIMEKRKRPLKRQTETTIIECFLSLEIDSNGNTA